MLGCSGQRVSEYIDGDLSPTAAREFERHLWACPGCRDMLLDFRALLAMISQARPYLYELQRDTSTLRDTFGRRRATRIVS